MGKTVDRSATKKSTNLRESNYVTSVSMWFLMPILTYEPANKIFVPLDFGSGCEKSSL